MYKEVVDEINGLKITDPYRWLENADDPEVKTWIAEQNLLTDNALRGKVFDMFLNDMAKAFKVKTFSNPAPVKGKYFYTERGANEDQAALYFKYGLNGEPVKLFDPNGKRDKNTMTVDYWSESNSGKYIVYGVSEGGDEMATLYIKNTDTNENLEESILNCRYSSVRWLPDDSGFFYTRNAIPGSVPKNEEHLHVKVYLHQLGDDPKIDKLIFGHDRPKDDMITLALSPDGRFLAVKVMRTWTESEIYIYDHETHETKVLVKGLPAKFSVLFLRDKVLIHTDHNASNYRVIHSSYEDMYRPVDEWAEFIPENDCMIETVVATKSKVLVEYLENACSKVEIFDYDGNKLGVLPLPECSSLSGIAVRRDEDEFFYGVDSFLFPKITFRYDPSVDECVEYQKTDSPIDPREYEVKQEWFVSKDLTRVPMFIFHKKGLELSSANPTILHGYGGFGNSQTPVFLRNLTTWAERGGVVAIANVRGGGEYGENWHKAGIKEHKQNTFDDFIAAAEHLITRGYTSSSHLGIFGGSNGGLLVSAVAVQRPNLFQAVCSRVPLTDMVRFPKFGMALRWVHEYGNPDVLEDLKSILKWSPYHNVKDGVSYPNFLFTTGDKDTRVDPLHARKMAAMLQSVRTDNDVWLFTELDAGHGPGKPIAKVVESQALMLSFFAMKLGLRV